jgi:hypothetical protein
METSEPRQSEVRTVGRTEQVKLVSHDKHGLRFATYDVLKNTNGKISFYRDLMGNIISPEQFNTMKALGCERESVNECE